MVRSKQIIIFISIIFISFSGIALAQEAPSFIQENKDGSFTFTKKKNDVKKFNFLSVPSKDEIVLIKQNTEVIQLQSEINKKTIDITTIEKEINELNIGLQKAYKQKDTLNSKLKKSTLENKKNEAGIKLSQQNIQKGKLELETLGDNINTNSENISLIEDVLIYNFRRINEFEVGGVSKSFFIDKDFFTTLVRIEETNRLSNQLDKHLSLVQKETASLRDSQKEVKNERRQLLQEKEELKARRAIYDQSIKQQQRLLVDTQSSEAKYQALIQEKEELRVSLAQDIAVFESQIQFIHDPTKLPKSGTKLFRKPFKGSKRVTQNFGRTAYAIKNAARYGGAAFHTGVDFGMPTGTKLIAPANGVVVAVGDTDVIKTCVLWGKWILIKHDFGLTTLYAHMSHTSVSEGQEIKEGELIGYSGNTGFSTGPHLHFGVYASDGIKAVPYTKISSSSRCKGVTVPVAATSAKLNPIDYLIL